MGEPENKLNGEGVKFFTEEQAAALMQIAEVTLRKMRYNGKAKYSRYGRLIRYTEQDILTTHEMNRPKAA